MSTNASPVPRLVGDVITRAIRKKAEKAKTPTNGAVSVSELLGCSIKPRLRRECPSIQDDSIGIADGFILECEVYETILELFGDKVVFRKHMFPYVSSHGLCVEGHCDLAIIGKDKLVVIQINSEGETPHIITGDVEGFVIHDQELLKRISFDESLIEQARIQRYIAQRAVPDMEVEHYLLLKTTLKFPGGSKRVFLLRKTLETISHIELEDLINRHVQVAGPKQAFECSYCSFKTKGVCDGQEAESVTVRSSRRSLEGLKPEVQEAIERYTSLYKQMLELEEFLKPALMDGFLKGDFVEMNVNGKKVKFGWLSRVSYVWDFNKLFKLLGNELFKYVHVNFWSLNELEARVSSMTDLASVRETKREQKWKGLV
jgi:hypothetical protein